MLWADKHRPKDFSALDFHTQQATDLKNLTKDGDFPHLLVYGPLGAGKKTRIMCLLRELFGPGVDRVKSETMHFTTPSNKKLEISTLGSNHHIEVNPSDAGIYDRIVVTELIKSVAQTQQVYGSSQREFKVIILTDVDGLTKDAQHALRRTMEKYVASCRIILSASSISRVIPAIRSRCLCIRVPAPSIENIVKVLTSVNQAESAKIPEDVIQDIGQKCDRNLRRAILMMEAYKVESGAENTKTEISEPDWQIFIKSIAKRIVQQQNIQSLAQIREDLYDVLVFGLPSDLIFTELLKQMLKICDSGLAALIIEQAALYQHRMSQSNKEIFHLEAFVCKCMCLYQKMMQELMGAEF